MIDDRLRRLRTANLRLRESRYVEAARDYISIGDSCGQLRGMCANNLEIIRRRIRRQRGAPGLSAVPFVVRGAYVVPIRSQEEVTAPQRHFINDRETSEISTVRLLNEPILDLGLDDDISAVSRDITEAAEQLLTSAISRPASIVIIDGLSIGSALVAAVYTLVWRSPVLLNLRPTDARFLQNEGLTDDFLQDLARRSAARFPAIELWKTALFNLASVVCGRITADHNIARDVGAELHRGADDLPSIDSLSSILESLVSLPISSAAVDASVRISRLSGLKSEWLSGYDMDDLLRLTHEERGHGNRRLHVSRYQLHPHLLEARVEEYKRARSLTKPRYVVYTAISDNYDTLKIPQVLPSDCDFVCFTDRPIGRENTPWKTVPIDAFMGDATRTARFVKTHPHLYFGEEYEVSVWIDAHVLIAGDLLFRIIHRFMESAHVIGAIPHPYRQCTYEEANACLVDKKDDPSTIRHQISRYREEGFPQQFGLIETQILIRRHYDSRAQRVNDAWWQEIQSGSRRDQISLMYVLWKTSSRWLSIMRAGDSTRSNDGFLFFGHGLVPKNQQGSYAIPEFLPSDYGSAGEPYWLQRTRAPAFADGVGSSDTEVEIIIPVHDALSDVTRCLESVETHRPRFCSIIIVDDGSSTDTADYLRSFSDATSRVTLVRHHQAHGYTVSVNAGLRKSSAPFVVLLNSDTIVTSNWIDKLVEAAYSKPLIGIVGPVSNAASWQSVPVLRDPETGTYMINKLPDGLVPEDLNQICQEKGRFPVFPIVPLVNGFCYGIKREVIQAIGLFDETAFPLGYGEENDYSFRAQQAGFVCAIATHTYVYHAKSRSFGLDARMRLSTSGGKILDDRYGSKRIELAKEAMKANPLMHELRRRILAEQSLAHKSRRGSQSAVPDNHPTEPPAQNYRPMKWGLSHMSTAGLSAVDWSWTRTLSESARGLFPSELELAHISLKELRDNETFVASMPDALGCPPKTALWIVPSVRNLLAGGIRTALAAAEHFSLRWETHNVILELKTSAHSAPLRSEDIRSQFPALDFELNTIGPDFIPSHIRESDIAICTSWPTAYALARYNRTKVKYYFAQDYETRFYSEGAVSRVIEETYRFGFTGIANTPGIAKAYRRAGGSAHEFMPGIDHEVFFPPVATSYTEPQHSVVFYARPGNVRNMFPLGLQALRIVKQEMADLVRIICVGADWDAKKLGFEGILTNMGKLKTLEDVAEVYRGSTVGLSLMSTPHPSYQPFEMFACKCAVVTNDNPDLTWFYRDGENCITARPHPAAIAEAVVRLLKDDRLRESIAAAAYRDAQRFKWADAFQQIASIVTPDK